MADVPWYKRVVSPLKMTWDRVKTFAREELERLDEKLDVFEPENDAWGIESHRVASELRHGRINEATAQKLHEEAVQRRYDAWRAFRPDPYETIQRNMTPVIEKSPSINQVFGPRYTAAREAYFAEVERRHETAASPESHHD